MSAFSQHLLTENGPFSPLMEAVENDSASQKLHYSQLPVGRQFL